MPEDIQKIFTQNLNRLLSSHGKTQLDLAKYLEVSNTTVNNWSKGYNTPRMDKIDRICKFFGVTRENLLKDHCEEEPDYYMNEDARDMAEFLFKNPKYKVLFDASRKVKAEDIEFVKKMIDRMSGDDEP